MNSPALAIVRSRAALQLNCEVNMSVFMTLRVQGDPKEFEEYASSNAEMMQRIAEAGKAAGAIRHAFGGSDDEIIVIDEWPDEASFQRFFESQTEIPRLMQEGGVKGAPQISFYRKLDTRDEF
jgi:hypothetical protein